MILVDSSDTAVLVVITIVAILSDTSESVDSVRVDIVKIAELFIEGDDSIGTLADDTVDGVADCCDMTGDDNEDDTEPFKKIYSDH